MASLRPGRNKKTFGKNEGVNLVVPDPLINERPVDNISLLPVHRGGRQEREAHQRKIVNCYPTSFPPMRYRHVIK